MVMSKLLCSFISSIPMTSALYEAVVNGYDETFNSGVGGAGVFILDIPTKTILLGRRAAPDYHTGHWCSFGGTCESGESSLTTAIREISEEAGISPDMISCQPNHLYIDSDPLRHGFKFMTYLATTNNQFDINLNDEHDNYGWFPLTKLPQPLHPGVNRMLADPHVMRRLLNTFNGACI